MQFGALEIGQEFIIVCIGIHGDQGITLWSCFFSFRIMASALPSEPSHWLKFNIFKIKGSFFKFLKSRSGGLSAVSAVKGTFCSCEEPQLGSQHPHWRLIPSCSSNTRDLTPSSGLWVYLHEYMYYPPPHIHKHTTYSWKWIIKLMDSIFDVCLLSKTSSFACHLEACFRNLLGKPVLTCQLLMYLNSLEHSDLLVACAHLLGGNCQHLWHSVTL